MNIKLFTLPFNDENGAFDDSPLSDFAEGRDITGVHQHMIVRDGRPFWCILITYVDPKPAASRQAARERRKHPKDDLPPEKHALYEGIRQWRNARAQRDGRPAYVLFSNQEIAEIARLAPASKSDLISIPGIGDAKARDYGDEVLEIVARVGSGEVVKEKFKQGDEQSEAPEEAPNGL
jgi:superfamily II DNA helicase RecQ